MQPRPVVHLVGAGPGDPELLTLKAVRVLRAAEVVVHDRLVGAGVLDFVPPEAERICVGKHPGGPRIRQEEINDLLVRRALTGRRVVRLKGGDPFLFGRGGEEVLHLLAHGIHVEVVPGITAAFGAAAELLVPLTHRGLASGVRFVTGHCRDDGALDLDWEKLADPDTTLVVYMGLANVREIVRHLMAAGLPAGTPALAVERATCRDMRWVCAPLGDLAAKVAELGLRPPVLFVIGRVAALAAPAGCPAGWTVDGVPDPVERAGHALQV